MKIELRNIHLNQRMSEETYCYDAKLYVDDKHIADIMNRGHGGPDEINARPGCEALLKAAEDHCRAQPPIKAYGHELPFDLEMLCGDLISDFELRKVFDRRIKAKVLIHEEGKVFEYGFKNTKQIEQKHIDAVLKKEPREKILNLMAKDQAFAIFKAAAKEA